MIARGIVLVAACLAAQAQGVSIQGTLLGQDGRPMVLAHVRVLSLEG